MNLFYGIGAAGLFFGASALFSGLETGGYVLNRIRLRVRARSGLRSARRLESVLCDAHRFVFTVLIANNIANYLLSREVTRLYLRSGTGAEHGRLFGVLPWNAETAAALTLMLPVFFFAELIPKNLFSHHADLLMYRWAGVLAFSERLLRPASGLLKGLFRALTGGRGRTEVFSAFSLTLQGFRDFFSSETHRRILSDHQHGMINNLIAMHQVPVAAAMQPLTAVPTLSERASVRQVLDLMHKADVDQIAVWRGSIRNLTGLVSLFDLIGPDAGTYPERAVKPLVRKLSRLSSDIPLTQAFRKLRQKNETVAAVTDRAGRTVGILHLRDIARYIVSPS